LKKAGVKMKKFLGTYMSNTMLIICIIAIIAFFIATCEFVFNPKLAQDRVIGATVMGLVVLFYIFLLILTAPYYLSWGVFEKDKLTIKCLFRKDIVIEYEKMKDAGVGYYFHSGMGTPIGSRVNYLYLSGKKLTDFQKEHMNMIPLSKSFLRCGIKKDLYEYLLVVLPPELSATLKKNYEEYFADYYKDGKSKFFKR
jgi:hypothetical protein